jgi:hypothetical protein
MWVKYLCRMDDARLCRADFYCSSRLPDVDLVGDTGRSPPVASFSSTHHCHVTNNSDIRIANAVNKSLDARVTKEVSELVHENDKLVGRENRPDEVDEERRLLTSDRLTDTVRNRLFQFQLFTGILQLAILFGCRILFAASLGSSGISPSRA